MQSVIANAPLTKDTKYSWSVQMRLSLPNAIVISQKKENNKKRKRSASLQDEVRWPCNHEHEVAMALLHCCVLPLLRPHGTALARGP